MGRPKHPNLRRSHIEKKKEKEEERSQDWGGSSAAGIDFNTNFRSFVGRFSERSLEESLEVEKGGCIF